jgi:anti-sigma regulatory factor (Ser/Thr protein kinase)
MLPMGFNISFAFVKVISSSKDEADCLIDDALAYFYSLKSSGFVSAIEEFDFRLVLDEAVDNAIRHGNRNDPNKKVMVIIKEFEGKVNIIVRDEGSGFIPEIALLRAMHRRDCDPGGRGLHLISSLGEVKWNVTGNRIRIELTAAVTRRGSG